MVKFSYNSPNNVYSISLFFVPEAKKWILFQILVLLTFCIDGTRNQVQIVSKLDKVY